MEMVKILNTYKVWSCFLNDPNHLDCTEDTFELNEKNNILSLGLA